MHFVEATSNQLINLAQASTITINKSPTDGKGAELVVVIRGKEHTLTGKGADDAVKLLRETCPHLTAVPGFAPKPPRIRVGHFSG